MNAASAMARTARLLFSLTAFSATYLRQSRHQITFIPILLIF